MLLAGWGRVVLAGLLLASASGAFASESNAKLQATRDADQAERASGLLRQDWKLLVKHDMERQARVRELLSDGSVVTATDYYNAALVMQHGQSVNDYRLANALASIAAQLDPENADAKWLAAATWDRLLESMKQPQWYGTQFVKNSAGRVVLYPVAPGAVSDDDRRAMHVPPLHQSEERAERMNAGSN